LYLLVFIKSDVVCAGLDGATQHTLDCLHQIGRDC